MLSEYKDVILHRLNVDKELLKDVAEDYGVKPNALSIARIKWMGEDWYPLNGSPLDQHQDDIIQRWADNETIASIARSYDVNQSTMWHCLERWNCFLGY